MNEGKGHWKRGKRRINKKEERQMPQYLTVCMCCVFIGGDSKMKDQKRSGKKEKE
jgi:hypothetical protein